MKKFLLSACMLCLAATAMYAQNLVTNSGFETWTVNEPLTNMPDSWARGAGTVGTHYLYATDAVQGNVLRLKDNIAPAGAKRFNTTANFSVLTEGTYRVTFKVKGDVGLRFIALVKGTASPSSSSQTATNHFTNVAGYPSPTVVSDWTTVQTDIAVPSTATFGDDYRLHISWSHSTTSLLCDFLIDDISLVKYVETPVTSDKLQKIEITPAGYTPGTGTPDMTIPAFNQETLNYTFTSSYKDVPVISATAVDATANVQLVQATSLTGTQVERTATITVTTTDSQVKTYTVELVKHPGFISGISWNLRTDNFVEWETTAGMYTRDNQSAGAIYAFGNTSARCNSASASGFHLTTPELMNGASTLSFYLKNMDIAGDNTQVVVKKSTTAAPDWTEIGRVQPNTSDYNNVWKEVTMNINDNANGLKIRFEFEKTIETSGKVYLDDVVIQPYSPISNVNTRELSSPVLVGQNGRIIFTSPEVISFSVFAINGSKVAEGIASQGHSISLSRGIYIVKTQSQTLRVVL
ncbi:MAG: choice-of-anchor J domain-containing protein [Paludibacter sp.]|jgi:hypothetical protein|nr:choice-of-anchor J domain-containing protein [Paludibacter sp.]